MTDEESLITGILFTPRDVGAYNALIDWLLDHGEEEKAAQWIRNRDMLIPFHEMIDAINSIGQQGIEIPANQLRQLLGYNKPNDTHP